MIQANIAKYENLSSAIKEDEELDEHLKTSTTQQLQCLETELKQYFLELKEQKASFVQNPFLTACDIPNELQDIAA